MAKSVVVLSTLDTKGRETAFLKEQIEHDGCRAVLIDPDHPVRLEGEMAARAAGTDGHSEGRRGIRACDWDHVRQADIGTPD